ncbi:MAG: hypothetical protein ACI936_000045 [Paraglaciecola sp.]|jgi:hypothetical protein
MKKSKAKKTSNKKIKRTNKPKKNIYGDTSYAPSNSGFSFSDDSSDVITKSELLARVGVYTSKTVPSYSLSVVEVGEPMTAEDADDPEDIGFYLLCTMEKGGVIPNEITRHDWEQLVNEASLEWSGELEEEFKDTGIRFF